MSAAGDMVRRSSALVMTYQSGYAPDEVCEAIGVAVTMGKPIFLIITAGSRLPAKMSAVVDRFIEWDTDGLVLGNAIKEAMIDIGLLNGCTCDGCKKEADSNGSGHDGADGPNAKNA